jgi:hypothetical protein
MEKKLIIGQRYTFYLSNGGSIRANCKKIINHDYTRYNDSGSTKTQTLTIILNCDENENNKETEHCVPIDMIVKIENLETILADKPILVPDVILLIDGYY